MIAALLSTLALVAGVVGFAVLAALVVLALGLAFDAWCRAWGSKRSPWVIACQARASRTVSE